MFKKKKFFVTFEGIEGSGKSFQSSKLFQKIKKKKISAIFTREPGGSPSAEIIRKILLTGKKNKFDKNTDLLLYLASRNEHIRQTLMPAFIKKKVVICDRFTDSTLAYQVYGKSVDKEIVNIIHKKIFKDIKPDLTFILKVDYAKVLKRLKKRKNNNRYDKFSKRFYLKVQNAFIKISKSNKRKYILLDSSKDDNKLEKIIFKEFIKAFKNEKN